MEGGRGNKAIKERLGEGTCDGEQVMKPRKRWRIDENKAVTEGGQRMEGSMNKGGERREEYWKG